MIPHLLFYQLAVLGLLWLFGMLHTAWPSRCATAQGTPATPIMLRRQRSKEPKPFAGLTHKPSCALCEHATASRPQAPCAPPPPIVSTRGRRRQVNTSRHFCPAPACRYGGWLGLGNIRANGLPTICQAEFVTFFTPSALRAHNESGLHHNTYDDAAWPSGYAGVGRQYCVRPGHAAVPSPVTPYTPG
jgi:hypothetical protein